jgi:hypothetical protein
LGLREQVFGYVERENAEGFSGIGRVERYAGSISASVFDVSLERVARKDENAPVVLAVLGKPIVPGHRPNGAAAQLRVEAIDGWRQLHPAAFERSPELVVECDYLFASAHTLEHPRVQ